MVSALTTAGCTCIGIVPMVGAGINYRENGSLCRLINDPLPSGGFARTWQWMARDILAGAFSRWRRQRRAVRDLAVDADFIVIVGDFFALVTGAFRIRLPVYFIPTAKSDRISPHWWIERWGMRRWCQLIFPRDPETAGTLSAHGLPAVYQGNPLYDGVRATPTNRLVTHRSEIGSGDSTPQRTWIGVLPGSRDEAVGNLKKIIDILRQFPRDRFIFLLGIAPNCQFDPSDVQFFDHVYANFNEFLGDSEWIIGLAGTAVEQAVNCGKMVFTFVGTGPQTTRQRLTEQQRLMGKGIVYIESRQSTDIAKFIYAWIQEGTSVIPAVAGPVETASLQISRAIMAHFGRNFGGNPG